jgi:hypothetical protein
MLIVVFITFQYWTLFRKQINTFHTHAHYFFKIHINIATCISITRQRIGNEYAGNSRRIFVSMQSLRKHVHATMEEDVFPTRSTPRNNMGSVISVRGPCRGFIGDNQGRL